MFRHAAALTILKQYANTSQTQQAYPLNIKEWRGAVEMKQLKKIFLALLFPGTALAAVLTCLAGAALAAAFLSPGAEPLFCDAAYALSAYALTVLAAWAVRDGRRVFRRISIALHANPLAGRWMEDPELRLQLSLRASFCLNAIYAFWKLGCGLYYRSLWFAALGGYYWMLALMRFLLLRGSRRNLRTAWRRYGLCGALLLVFTCALGAVVVQMVLQQRGFRYPGYLIYVMAMYAFYMVAMAIKNVIKYRKRRNPVLSAAKNICFAAALTSMLSLETAMLEAFGSAQDPTQFRLIMTAATGAGVLAIILVLAIRMMWRARTALREMEALQ